MAFFNWFKKDKNKNENKLEQDSNEILQNVNFEDEKSEQIQQYEEDLIKEEKLEQEIEKIRQDLEKINNNEDIFENTEDEKFLNDTLEEDKTEELEKVTNNLDENFQDEYEEDLTIQYAEQKEEHVKKENFFTKIKNSLNKTRDNILKGIDQVLATFTKVDEELFEELEETLIMADIGMETSLFIMQKVREIVKLEKITEVEKIKNVIIRVITEIMLENTNKLEFKTPSVVLVIGVNGVGKTTTIGKLTNYFKEQDKKVILAAADTFRAAAIDQLEIWGERNSVDVIKHQENSDPGAVVFDAIKAAKARKADVLICDTAGRLHNKKNLMEELKKISRIIKKEYEEAQIEVFLVLDSTTGQNALQQAKLFSEVTDITGIVLTKLDGTAKGGIIISIKNELNIPVRFIGIGEGINDLRPFEPSEFAEALFDNQ